MESVGDTLRRLYPSKVTSIDDIELFSSPSVNSFTPGDAVIPCLHSGASMSLLSVRIDSAQAVSKVPEEFWTLMTLLMGRNSHCAPVLSVGMNDTQSVLTLLMKTPLKDLRHVLDTAVSEHFSERAVMSIMSRVCAGLMDLHALNLSHLNISAESIVFYGEDVTDVSQHDGNVKLLPNIKAILPIDECGQAVGRSIVEKYAYAAPEQVRGLRRLTPAADVYSLAMLAVHVLTRTNPFLAMDFSQIFQHYAQKRTVSVPDSVSPGLRDLLQRCLQFEPSQRPTSKEVYDELLGLQQTTQACVTVASLADSLTVEAFPPAPTAESMAPTVETLAASPAPAVSYPLVSAGDEAQSESVESSRQARVQVNVDVASVGIAGTASVQQLQRLQHLVDSSVLPTRTALVDAVVQQQDMKPDVGVSAPPRVIHNATPSDLGNQTSAPLPLSVPSSPAPRPPSLSSHFIEPFRVSDMVTGYRPAERAVDATAGGQQQNMGTSIAAGPYISPLPPYLMFGSLMPSSIYQFGQRLPGGVPDPAPPPSVAAALHRVPQGSGVQCPNGTVCQLQHDVPHMHKYTHLAVCDYGASCRLVAVDAHHRDAYLHVDVCLDGPTCPMALADFEHRLKYSHAPMPPKYLGLLFDPTTQTLRPAKPAAPVQYQSQLLRVAAGAALPAAAFAAPAAPPTVKPLCLKGEYCEDARATNKTPAQLAHMNTYMHPCVRLHGLCPRAHDPRHTAWYLHASDQRCGQSPCYQSQMPQHVDAYQHRCPTGMYHMCDMFKQPHDMEWVRHCLTCWHLVVCSNGADCKDLYSTRHVRGTLHPPLNVSDPHARVPPCLDGLACTQTDNEIHMECAAHWCKAAALCEVANDRAHPEHNRHVRLFKHICPHGSRCSFVKTTYPAVMVAKTGIEAVRRATQAKAGSAPQATLLEWDAYDHADRFIHTCLHGAACTMLDRDDHTARFQHPCPVVAAGKICDLESDDPTHALYFSHPCAAGAQCTNSSALHEHMCTHTRTYSVPRDKTLVRMHASSVLNFVKQRPQTFDLQMSLLAASATKPPVQLPSQIGPNAFYPAPASTYSPAALTAVLSSVPAVTTLSAAVTEDALRTQIGVNAFETLRWLLDETPMDLQLIPATRVTASLNTPHQFTLCGSDQELMHNFAERARVLGSFFAFVCVPADTALHTLCNQLSGASLQMYPRAQAAINAVHSPTSGTAPAAVTGWTNSAAFKGNMTVLLIVEVIKMPANKAAAGVHTVTNHNEVLIRRVCIYPGSVPTALAAQMSMGDLADYQTY